MRLALKAVSYVAIVVLVALLLLTRRRADAANWKAAAAIEKVAGALAAQSVAMAALNHEQVESVAGRQAAQAAQAAREKAQAGVIERLGTVRNFVREAIRMERKGPSIWRSTMACWISCLRGVIRRICLQRTVCSTS